MDVRGDLKVFRSGSAIRRFDGGLIEVTGLATARSLSRHSHQWQRIETDDLGVQDVVLPDATTLETGWSVVVQNFGGVDALNVKQFDSVTPILLKLVNTGKAYLFTLVDNADENGIWHVNYLEDAEVVTANRYVQLFNATTDWGTAAGGYYSQTIAQTAHTRGVNPVFQVLEDVGTDRIKTVLDQEKYDNAGDITLRVSAEDTEDNDTDARFAGRIVVI